MNVSLASDISEIFHFKWESVSIIINVVNLSSELWGNMLKYPCVIVFALNFLISDNHLIFLLFG